MSTLLVSSSTSSDSLGVKYPVEGDGLGLLGHGRLAPSSWEGLGLPDMFWNTLKQPVSFALRSPARSVTTTEQTSAGPG